MTGAAAYARKSATRQVALRVAFFALPPALAATYILALRAALSDAFFQIAFVAMVGYLLTPLGAEFWVPTSVLAVQAQGGGVAEAAWAVGSVVLVDWFSALFLLWNFDLAERMPWVGKFIDRTEVRCRRFLAEKPWRQRLALLALALYVALPVQMSGGVVGSILGRVMGIPRYRVFAIVCAASAAGAFPIAAATWVIGPPVVAWALAWAGSGFALVLGVLVLVAFVAAIVYMVRRGRKGGNDEAA